MIDLNGWILRPEYQVPTHEATIQHCRESIEAAVIDASVGAGKTLNIAAMAKHVSEKGGRVLVLARQGELVEQNSRKARSCGLRNSIFSASLDIKSTHYPVIMATEGTFARSLSTIFRKFPKRAEGEKPHEDEKCVFSFCAIDECHHVDWMDTLECIKLMKSGGDYLNSDHNQYSKIIAHLYNCNTNIRIIGYTGSPYRGIIDIIGKFWVKKIYVVETMYLVNLGYLVPPIFGFGDESHGYDLSEWTPAEGAGAADFTKKELVAMQRKITKDLSRTQIIMEEVIERTKNRNGVLITCAGKVHCKQVAACLPAGTWAIVTDSTGTKERRQTLIDARQMKIKYTIQVGCLTTGVDIPPWDTSVILRRIRSRTLITQLTGRILRILEQEDLERGLTKSDGLTLDYTDTFESFGDIYEDDPLLDIARAARSSDTGEVQECPECEQENSMYAVRCIGLADNEDGRCDHFFKFALCLRCKTMNSPSAGICRNCDAIMIDPSKALTNKAYTDEEYKKVLSMEWKKGSTKGLWVSYYLDSIYHKNGEQFQEVAKEYYDPFSLENHQKQRWKNFIIKHIGGEKWRWHIKNLRTVTEIIKQKAMFDVPTEVTHRINSKGFSIIARRKFLSGREEK